MKCSFYCKFYKCDQTYHGFEVWCAVRGFTIKDIKDKFPDIYLNCPKYQEARGR